MYSFVAYIIYIASEIYCIDSIIGYSYLAHNLAHHNMRL